MSLDLHLLTNLVTLKCSSAGLAGTLDVNGISTLTTLDCSTNASLTTLTLTGCSSLVALDCNGCDITGNLDVGLFTSLDHVYCYNNPNLTTLDIHGCTSIKDVLALGCGITTFNTANVLVVDSIDLTGNPLATLSLPDMTSLMLTLTLVNMPNLSGIAAPFLVFNDNLSIVNCPSFLTYTESNTAAVGGTIAIQNCSNLVSVTLSLLTSTSQDLFLNGNPLLTSISMPAGFISGVGFSIAGCTSLVSFATSFLGAGADQDFSGCTSLTTFNCPAWGVTDGTTVTFNGDALNSGSIDLILARAVASGMTTGTIDLSGGTNLSHASWSAGALADETTLTTAGVIVLSNP